LSAYEHYLLALDGRAKFTKEGIFAGIDEATKAIALDPNFARAYALRGRLEYNQVHYGVSYDTAIKAMEVDVKRGVELAPDDPDSRSALAWYLTLVGRVSESVQEIRAALKANPANVQVLYVAAAILAPTDQPEEAAQLADKVLRIDPSATAATLNTLKDAYFFSRQFQKLINIISRIPADARSRGSRMFLAMSYAFLGQDEQAERARKEFLDKYPTVSAELLLNQDWVFAYPEPEKLFIEGFRRTKLPLCASPEEIAKIAKPKRLPDCE
jgi:tetratricopeptide (TPR) repeat protein